MDNHSDNLGLINFNGVYSFEKEIYSSFLFDDLISVEFEGISVFVPKDYATILEKLYGNYMVLPKNQNIYHMPIKVKL